MNDDKRDSTVGGQPNLDPITKAPGAHPVGVGVGAAVGGAAVGVGTAAATGALAGSVAGPVGTVIGAAIGAVAGGLVGKSVAEHYDPTIEDAHWRENHTGEPYYSNKFSYDTDYAPAYKVGGEARTKYAGKSYEEAEPQLQSDWNAAKGTSTMTWDHAKGATKAAWDRIAD